MEEMFRTVIGSRIRQVPEDGEEKFYHLCKSAALEHSLEIYDLEYLNGNSIARVYISNPSTGTATLNECVLMNRTLGGLLEEEEWLPPSTTLEISSPGIGRHLSRQSHFIKALGKDISVVLKEAVLWAKKGEKIIARVLAVKDEEIQLKWKEQVFSLTWEMIKKANLKEEAEV